MLSQIVGSRLAGFRCYEAVVLQNIPAELGRNGPVSPVVKSHFERRSEKGTILLLGHNGVATRFRIIIGSGCVSPDALW